MATPLTPDYWPLTPGYTPVSQIAHNLCYNTAMKLRMSGGQAALEYVLALASLLVVVGILTGFVWTAARHADRSESLVSSDCP